MNRGVGAASHLRPPRAIACWPPIRAAQQRRQSRLTHDLRAHLASRQQSPFHAPLGAVPPVVPPAAPARAAARRLAAARNIARSEAYVTRRANRATPRPADSDLITRGCGCRFTSIDSKSLVLGKRRGRCVRYKTPPATHGAQVFAARQVHPDRGGALPVGGCVARRLASFLRAWSARTPWDRRPATGARTERAWSSS